MKKTTALVAALAVSLFSVNAFAQKSESQNESFFFNHWSVGVGLLEDFHIQAATTILPNLQLRVLYSTLHPYVGVADTFLKKNPNIGTINPFHYSFPVGYKGNGMQIDNIDLDAQLLSREINLFLDFFPSEISSIRFTGGVIIDLTPRIINATGTPNPALSQADRDKEFFGISADPQGLVHMYATYGLKTIRPYLGIGFGRPVDVQKRVSVNFDLGVAYINGLHIYSESYFDDPNNPKPVELNEKWFNDYPDAKNALGSSADKIIEYIGMANSFPVLPYARLTLNVRLF